MWPSQRLQEALCPTINALSIRWQMNLNSCLEITHSFCSMGKANCHTSLSFQPNSTVKSTICGSLGDGGGWFQLTRHIFSFQSPVFTKNSPVTHFHHNLLVSMFSVKTVTDAKHRRHTWISSYLFIFLTALHEHQTGFLNNTGWF